MKAVSLLQVIYSFFLGLLVLGLVVIGVGTFHPRPTIGRDDPNADWELIRAAEEAWSLTTSIVALVCATVILAVSLFRPLAMAVISNGLLLGGVFTMLYAVGVSLGAEGQIARFVVVVVALIVTVGVGYLTFVRRTPVAAQEPVGAAGGDAGGPAGDLAARVQTLERRLEALGRALNE